MGIRVNKALGWILAGKELDLEVLETLTLQDLKNEFAKDYEVCQLDLVYPEIDLSQKLINFVNDVSDEYTEGDRLYIFSPPFVNRDWHRHDDSIDYYDCDDGARKIKYLHGEIFPYAQKFVVSSSLKELTEIQKTQCWYFSENTKDLKQEVKDGLSALGLDLTKPLKSQIHMTCPKILRVILEKCGAVDYKLLQPAIVTYWG